jgi:RNA polymerase sigma-70 factor, ECF subfamily
MKRGKTMQRDDDLIKATQLGDIEAFHQLMKKYIHTVEKFAYQIGNNPHDIEDVTQEVFIRVYRFIQQYSKAKFTTWLYQITLNVTRDMKRKSTRSQQRLDKLMSQRQDFVEQMNDTLLESEEAKELHIALQKLDDKYKHPLVLFYFHEKKYDEIAEVLGLRLSTVKTRIKRAKDKLKAILIENEEAMKDVRG